MRTWLPRILLSLLALLVTGELAARVLLGNAANALLYQVDPGDGRCLGLKPGVSVRYTGWGYRVPGVIQEVNELGYRGPARPPGRDPGVLRIVAVGDSFTYGMGVPQDQSWPAYLEAELGQRLGRPVEVLNFGIPGTNIEEHVDQYRYFAHRWQPDLVLLAISPNDLELAPGQGSPLCDEASDLVINRLRHHLYLWRLASTVRPLDPAAEAAGDAEAATRQLHDQVGSLQRLARQDSADLAVLFFDRPPIARDSERFRLHIAGRLPVPALYGEGWLQAEHPQALPRIPRETHWTAQGNATAAGRIADWLLQEHPELL